MSDFTAGAAPTLAAYLLARIARDPRIAYYFDPMTQSMEMLTAARAAEMGVEVTEFREKYYARLKFEPPVKCDDLLVELRCVTDALNSARLVMDADGRRLAGELVNDARAAIARAEGRP